MQKQFEILQGTPAVVSALLQHLSAEWINANEGEGTWSPKEVLAHLIYCEESNWMPRVRIILSDTTSKIFAPLNMDAHFEIAQKSSLQNLLLRFQHQRRASLEEFVRYHVNQEDLLKTAVHPVIGEVELQQLVSAWAAHDLSHIAQIARILAKQNKESVGSFKKYLKILN